MNLRGNWLKQQQKKMNLLETKRKRNLEKIVALAIVDSETEE